MYCLKCGAQVENGATFCPVCGAAQNENAQNSVGSNLSNSSGLPMNWYKFLIYFGLFAGALINIVNGIRIVSGSVYDGYADYIYAMVSGLQALDIIVGLGLIALGALGIYTRFRLSGYCENGPKLLMGLYAGSVAIQLIYIIGCYMILPSYLSESLNLTSTIVNICVSGAMVYANKVYFEKRADQFKN